MDYDAHHEVSIDAASGAGGATCRNCRNMRVNAEMADLADRTDGLVRLKAICRRGFYGGSTLGSVLPAPGGCGSIGTQNDGS